MEKLWNSFKNKLLKTDSAKNKGEKPMRKMFRWIWNNILFLETLILLAFIPLYPKLPLINVRNTWVYVRAEDFLIVIVLISWIALLLRKKINLRTPLTLPILVFWLVGAIATFNGVLIIFPSISNVFPNVAFLSLVRHIEYLSLFFVAFQGMKDRNFLRFVIATVVVTLLGVVFYGFGQKYLGFPAFLTSNEEFAKGIPIQLSQLSRIPSTFAGHYDLAAYLVLIIPIIASLVFGIKNYLIKIFLVVTVILSFILLLMTVSRVSLFAVLASLLVIVFFQKRKIVFFLVPIAILAGILFVSLKPAVLSRFESTLSNIDVLVDANTGDAIGHLEYVSKDVFKDKVVLQRKVNDEQDLLANMQGQLGAPSASLSANLPFDLIPNQVPLLHALNISNGESLPQGTAYINLTLSPVVKRVGSFFYEFSPNVKSSPSASFVVLHGNFIVKRAAAYDLSFTTRFQGEWPRTLAAFERNVLLGSGYGSVSLAVDNNYLRMLGEVGLLGFAAFITIFISFGIYLKKGWALLKPGLEKSFILGFLAGLIGLGLNATLIDVFEASKVAYTLWLLTGVSLAVIVFNIKSPVNLFFELKRVATSTYAIFIYLLGIVAVLYSSMLNNFFVADDFTWLRWAAQAPTNLLTYFTQSDGFFYRPGTKIYFYLMYHFFWLNPLVYHLVSLSLHFVIAILFFILAKKIFKNTTLSALCAFLFLIMSGFTESVFWIATTGHQLTALLGILGLLLFIQWEEKRNKIYYLLSFISFSLALLFHELGVILPLLILAFRAKDGITSLKKTILGKDFLLLFVPTIFYLILRFMANSHWQGGDYSYNLLKFPVNFVGNALGYAALVLAGPSSLNFYEKLRSAASGHLVILLGMIPILLLIFALLYIAFKKLLDKEEKSIVIFGLSFFIISLLPFLGLGNITSRYSYLASLGLIPIIIVLIKKIYFSLLSSGKEIAIGTVVLLFMVYSLFHIISVQQDSANWAGASTKTNNFFISFDSSYSDYWSQTPTQFHFVNVPTKVGDAWVFPVGLSDAVWLTVKSDKAVVHIDKDVETALREVGSSLTDKIFVFNDDGSLKEITNRIIK